MAGEWEERRLGDLVESYDAIRIPVKEPDRKPGPYPYYGASGVVDHIDQFLFDGEYLLIAEDGENLRTRNTPVAFIANGQFWVNNHAHVVRGNSDADTRFLMYALAGTDISGFLSGSTIPKLTQGSLRQIPILTPPLNEQRRIARILGSLDDKIDFNRRMSVTLEAMALALFNSWFVDFDPVRAKLEGRASALPPEVCQLFPSAFEDSEAGQMPAGWQVAPIADCCVEIQNGGTPSRDEPTFWEGGEIPWLTSGEVRQPIVVSTTQFITAAGLASCAAKWARPFSTVVALYGATAGQVSMVASEVTTNQAICSLIPKDHFAFFNYFSLRAATSQLESKAVGSAQQNISKGIVEETKVVLPPRELLTRFHDSVAPLFGRWISCLRESSHLAVIRDRLLAQLIPGMTRPASEQSGLGVSH